MVDLGGEFWCGRAYLARDFFAQTLDPKLLAFSRRWAYIIWPLVILISSLLRATNWKFNLLNSHHEYLLRLRDYKYMKALCPGRRKVAVDACHLKLLRTR